MAIADFRPAVAALPESVGQCNEAPEYTGDGLRAVRLQVAGTPVGLRHVAVAVDSVDDVRFFFDLRNDGRGRETLLRIDSRLGAERMVRPGAAVALAQNRVHLAAEMARGTPEEMLSAPALGPPAAVASRILRHCALWLDPWGMLSRLPDSVIPPPAQRPLPRIPEYDRAWREDTTLGDGYLTASGGSEGLGWLRQVILPVYRNPNGRPFAWLARGWVVAAGPQGAWRAATVAGWLGIGSDGPAGLIVFEIRNDGWVRFRYAAPAADDDGTAWAHTSQFAFGPTAITLVPWESHYLHGRASVTYLIHPGPHSLFASPDSPAAVVALLSNQEYGLTPLEIRGDWMRVRAQWPGPWCGTAADRIAEGWIRWRTPAVGPRLAIHTDC